MKLEKYENYTKCDSNTIKMIPSSWHITRLKNLATIFGGRDYKEVSTEDETQIPVYGSGGIIGYATKFLYNKTSVLLGRKGTIDKPLYVTNKFWSVDTMYYTKIKQDVSARYFFYLCTTIKFSYYQYGSAVPSMTQEDLVQNKFVIPNDKTLTTTIANYLDTKTQKIDNEISLLEQKIKKYQELKQTLIKETVLRGLDKDVELKDSGTQWIGDIPKSWTTDRLKNIFDERVGKNLDKNTGEAVTTNILSVMKDVGVINHRDKGNVGNKMAEDITNYKLVYPNDIVVNKMNIMIGSVGISKEFGALSIIYIILITKKNHYAKYYDYFFKMKAFQRSLRRIATGILEIREAVNMTLFMQESMTVPPYEEQVQIANYLYEKISKIDEIVKTIGTKIEVLKEFRKTLINDVVTGKVKVA